MLERFLFPGEKQWTPIGKLSGGEKRRLYLLSVIMDAPNILLLDEPTNDLDIETLNILEGYLETFQGAVLAVSHDRYFLDKTASRIFEFSEGGEVRQYLGNYADYLEKREQPPKTAPVEVKPKKQQDKPAAKRKLSYKEQYELDHIEDEITALEEKVAELGAQIEQNASDFVKLQELTEQKTALEEQLEARTERWMELTELAESM